jgi:hypothetical protein
MSDVCLLVSEPEDCVKEHNTSIEWIIANTINETAQGDPDALASRIVAAVENAGYQIAPDELGSQPFDELKPSMRPQDIYGDGRDWTFETCEHGGDEPDTMPQAIRATDALGRSGSTSRSPATARSLCRASSQPISVSLLHNFRLRQSV